jgi:hypothetical protein
MAHPLSPQIRATCPPHTRNLALPGLHFGQKGQVARLFAPSCACAVSRFGVGKVMVRGLSAGGVRNGQVGLAAPHPNDTGSPMRFREPATPGRQCCDACGV